VDDAILSERETKLELAKWVEEGGTLFRDEEPLRVVWIVIAAPEELA